MAAKQMTEAQMVNLVRNALLVAGTEMGETGDHWPVIKSTVHNIMKDYEDLKIERNVFEEIKKYYESMMQELHALGDQSPPEVKREIEITLKSLTELYDASFTSAHEHNMYIDPEQLPMHIKRAIAITKTLENDNAE